MTDATTQQATGQVAVVSNTSSRVVVGNRQEDLEYWNATQIRRYRRTVQTPNSTELKLLVRSLLRLGALHKHLSGEPRLLDQTNPALQPVFRLEFRTPMHQLIKPAEKKAYTAALMIQSARGRSVNTAQCRTCRASQLGPFRDCVTLTDHDQHFGKGACGNCVFEERADKCTLAIAKRGAEDSFVVEDSESDDSGDSLIEIS
ncbi:hypothetical protein KCV07_g9902, partial [Aureobasidium melanogenum]